MKTINLSTDYHSKKYSKNTNFEGDCYPNVALKLFQSLSSLQHSKKLFESSCTFPICRHLKSEFSNFSDFNVQKHKKNGSKSVYKIQNTLPQQPKHLTYKIWHSQSQIACD